MGGGFSENASLRPNDNGMKTRNYLVVFPLYGDIKDWDFTQYGLRLLRIDDDEFKVMYDPELKARLQDTQFKDILLLELQEYCYVLIEKEQTNKSESFFTFLTMIQPSAIKHPVACYSINYVERNGNEERLQVTTVTEYPGMDLTASLDHALIISANRNLFYRLFDNFLSKQADVHFEKLANIYVAAIRLKQPFLRFLLFMMMVDCLVVDNNFNVKRKIKHLTGVLFGSDADMSQRISDNMEILYQVRSAIVHDADTSGLTPERVTYMHYLCCEIMCTFLLGTIDLKTLYTKSVGLNFGDRKVLLNEYGITNDERYISNYAKLMKDVS